MGDVELRPMAIVDFTDVAAIWRETEGIGRRAADHPAETARFLARNPGLSTVAVAEGRIVGAVLCGHDGRRGFLHHLAVAPEARRRGIGRALVERCLEGLAAAGIRRCHLLVFGANEGAIAFWQRMGWNPRADLILFTREISDPDRGPITEAGGPIR